jgi:hypothetical protein
MDALYKILPTNSVIVFDQFENQGDYLLPEVRTMIGDMASESSLRNKGHVVVLCSNIQMAEAITKLNHGRKYGLMVDCESFAWDKSKIDRFLNESEQKYGPLLPKQIYTILQEQAVVAQTPGFLHRWAPRLRDKGQSNPEKLTKAMLRDAQESAATWVSFREWENQR